MKALVFTVSHCLHTMPDSNLTCVTAVWLCDKISYQTHRNDNLRKRRAKIRQKLGTAEGKKIQTKVISKSLFKDKAPDLHPQASMKNLIPSQPALKAKKTTQAVTVGLGRDSKAINLVLLREARRPVCGTEGPAWRARSPAVSAEQSGSPGAVTQR